MNKTEFVDVVAEKAGMTKKETKVVVESVLEAIQEAVGEQKDVNLTPLGKFKVTERAARKGRNPQTGEEIQIPAKLAVKFSPSKQFKESVN